MGNDNQEITKEVFPCEIQENSWDDQMTALVGKEIKSLRVSEDLSVIIFGYGSCKEKYIAYITVGECCSQTWFADITGVEALLGNEVIGWRTDDMETYNVDDGRGRDDVDSAYGITLFTKKGACSIVYRNSSNGYYGGNISPYNGDFTDKLILITDDWMA